MGITDFVFPWPLSVRGITTRLGWNEHRRAEPRDTPPKHTERSDFFANLPYRQNLAAMKFEQKTVARNRAAAPTRFRTCAVA